MSHTYSELRELNPIAYLDWQFFQTVFDGRKPGYADEQYKKGLEIGRQALAIDGGKIEILGNGTWGATIKSDYGENNYCYVSSYEGIGYHGHTAELLKGFLDSGAPIYVYRYGNSQGVRIK